MEHPAIFSATLGLTHPWHITSVSFVHEEGRMEIEVDFYEGNLFTCPRCGRRRIPCRIETETWRHDNFFRYSAYLHARVPYIECCDGIVPAERPWSRSGSRFTRVAAEELLAQQPAARPATAHPLAS